ncbi:MAG: T9SS type A sorting domain-containing protein [Flavobacterium sp.]|nr:T9SS type A sorting domain-containing protein [Flavobacterium sp.]
MKKTILGLLLVIVLAGYSKVITVTTDDYTDSQLDSAVFLVSSSMNILGPDLTIANNTAVCEGNTTTLSTGLSTSDYTFLWNKDGVVISNETGSSLVVTQPGIYEVVYTTIATSVVNTDSIVIEYSTPPLVGTFDNIIACEGYDLPFLSVGNYCTGPNGSGVLLFAGQIITSSVLLYVYASNGNCSSETSFMVTIEETPFVVQPQNLIISEENSDGVATFDLTSQIPAILNGQSPVNFQVSFFETESDATNNVNEIANPTNYTNTSNFQVIYCRVSTTNSNCFALSSFVLEVVNVSAIITFQDFIIYENNTDGVGTFDLTTQIPSIIGVDSNPDDYIVTFFLSYEDAISNLNQITNPTAFVNTSNPQTIYVRVTYLGGRSTTSTTVVGSIILSVQEPLSVLDVDLGKVTISPNPVVDYMTVAAKENFSSIVVFNALGQLVYQKKVTTNEEKVDLSALPSGNYIVKINSETASNVLKVIKL